MRVCLAVQTWSHTGDAAESTRKMCLVAVTQRIRDIVHLPVAVLQHLFRGIEPYPIQQFGIARFVLCEFALQTAFAQITYPRGKL